MTYEQYWYDPDYTLFWAYKAKHDIEIKRKKREVNYQSWLSGLYVLSAVGTLFSKDSKYFDEPIDFEGQEREYYRRLNMTEEERIAEDNKKLEIEMKAMYQRVFLSLQQQQAEQKTDN